MLVTEQNALTTEIEQLIAAYGKSRDSLMPILQEVQKNHGHISDYAQQEIARLLDIHPVEVYGVVTFYSFLKSNAEGKYIVRLCRTISCDMARKTAVAGTIEKELGIKFGETTPDKKFTLEYTNCLGMCDQGPAMLINDDIYTSLTPHGVVEILNNCR